MQNHLGDRKEFFNYKQWKIMENPYRLLLRYTLLRNNQFENIEVYLLKISNENILLTYFRAKLEEIILFQSLKWRLLKISLASLLLKWLYP